MESPSRVAVVTGAARNIGAAITAGLIADGWTVVAIDKDSDPLHQRCSGLGDNVVPLVVDLAHCDPVQLAADLIATHGTISGFVANAGVASGLKFLDLTPAKFDHVMTVNLRTHLFMAQGFARHLIEQRTAGSFVFLSSVHQEFRHGSPDYSASKAAIAIVVREMAADLGAHSIRVNAIAPGFTNEDPSRVQAWALPHIPIGRAIAATEIADVVTFLMSERATAVTGANWTIDGGLTTHSWSDHGSRQ